jgi:short subunit dehydrogenase-like uncharacterized protein
VTDQVVIYGANGATGLRLVEIAVAAGIRPIVAGRRREALDAVARPHGLEVRVGGLADRELDGVVAGAAVVVSCVAPYTTRGKPLVDAALRHGAHYVDCTGEPRYVQGLIARDSEAVAARSAIIPAAGIGLVANVVARAAVEGLKRVETLTVDYRIQRMRPSWGTACSTVHLLAGGAAVVRGGKVSFVTPGRRVRRLARGNTGALFPLTDTLTLSRQWPTADVESFIQSRVAPAFAGGLAVGALLARVRGVPGLVDRAARRFRDADAAPPKGRFVVTVTAEGAGRRQTAVAHVDDIYEITSQAAFELTRTLLTDGCEPGFRSSGQVIGAPAEVAARIGIRLDAPASTAAEVGA